MKVSQLIGERTKERPADCTAPSHTLMMRGGYLCSVASGIWSQTPALRRVTRKIEDILRGEMEAIGGQEVQLPVVMPAALWQESGRYESIGAEMARFSDRNGTPMVLGMTHEEAAVHLVREYGRRAERYPFMIYQIQTKFRDEARPRAGLIRVREFTMKDAYSFHTTQADLEDYYSECHRAYERIFAKVGIPEVVSVLSDSGMMGGAVSHEFMLLTDIGEDSIAVCADCGFHANTEVLRRDDGICPICGKQSITVKRGIEVGNIFQLGTKYTRAMHMTYRAQNGEERHPLMGCYGIGVGRLAAAVCEVRHDDRGLVWPMRIAPWQVHLCAVRADDAAVHSTADALYKQLSSCGIEVLYDDRDVRAGVMFAEADLMGVPLRVVISPRNLENGMAELCFRDSGEVRMVRTEALCTQISLLIRSQSSES